MTAATNHQAPNLVYRLTFRFGILLTILGTPFLLDFFLHPLEAEAVYASVLWRISLLVLGGTIAIIGYLCARKAPGNIIGPLLIIFAASHFFFSIRNTASPMLIVIALQSGAIFFWSTYGLLLACFPTGNFYFRRLGRWANSILIVYWGLITFAYIVGISEFAYASPDSPAPVWLPNPLFTPRGGLLLSIVMLGFTVVVSTYIGFAFVSQIIRYRAAGSEERQQLKWFTFGIAIWIATTNVVTLIPNRPDWLNQANEIYGIVSASLFPPLAIGVAILRHRLYDIDIIIRRTLVYSILSGLLALTFFGAVTVVQSLFRSFTGQSSDLAIVVSTLAIAALFTPLRRRVQNTIDRRFYRRKYDAEQTLAQFAVLARDEVDVEKLKAAMVGVVQETMQPTSVMVWVPDSKKQKVL